MSAGPSRLGPLLFQRGLRSSRPALGLTRADAGTRAGRQLPTAKRRFANRVISKERYNFNTSLNSSEEPDPDHVNYRRVTASELSTRSEPPRRVKMLMRDFIDDSLYNPQYGYFSQNATIFTPPRTGYDFSKFADSAAFQEAVASRYEEYAAKEDALDNLPSTSTTSTTTAAASAEPSLDAGGVEESVVLRHAKSRPVQKGKAKEEVPRPGKGGLGRQVWHTPTELFKPYYARALTQSLLTVYKLNHFPDQDFIIYEVGAGNGSFMVDCLKFLRDEHPEVFMRTRYRIIEISPALASIQTRRAAEEGLEGKVEVIQKDVFSWEGAGAEPCFVVALEVFDNFAHDMIRYDLTTLDPLQAVVAIAAAGVFTLLYEPLTDPLLRRVLAYRHILPPTPSTGPPLSPALLSSSVLRNLYSRLPFAPNLSAPDWIPTKSVLFLERLRDRLPGHRLLVADFDSLPDTVPGRNGPVVQTRYGNAMIPCETVLVKQGYFDIFFPTDFELLRDTYSLIMNSPSPSFRQAEEGEQEKGKGAKFSDFFSSTGIRGFRRRKVGIHSQADFLSLYGGEECIAPTRTRDGGSVMLGMYGNAKIMF